MDFTTKVRLNDGNEIPIVGFGTIRVPDEAIITALKAGYRHLDTASMYKYNEAGIGNAIASGLVPREDIFVCTKLWTADIRDHRTREAFMESLNKLQTNYVDLYLIHWPVAGYLEAYQELEKLKQEGYIRSIGVSNFRKHHLETLFANTSVIPAVNEMECNPGFMDYEAIEFCRQHGIAVEASAPLGEGRYTNMEELRPLAQKYQKFVPQIILRWLLQKDIIVVPKSTRRERIIDNANLFDFALTDEEMTYIDSLNRSTRSYGDPDTFNFYARSQNER